MCTPFGSAHGWLCLTFNVGCGFASAEVKGDGQECPSHTSLWLEHSGIVLFEVDLVGALVLLRVGLVFPSKLPGILFAIAVDLMMERGFFGFEMGGLTCGQLSGFKFSRAMLLRARSGGALGMNTGDDGVVLLLIDGLRYMILPVLESGAVGGGKASAIVFAHSALFGARASFFSFQGGSFARGPLAVLDIMGDMFLRMLLAPLNCRLVCGRFRSGGSAGCLRDNGYGQRGQAGGQEHILHRGSHTSMLGQAMGGGNEYPYRAALRRGNAGGKWACTLR